MIRKIKIKTTLLLTLVFLFSFGIVATVRAQEVSTSIKGAIKDEFGRPLAGVAVNLLNGEVGTSTDSKGEFTITIGDHKEPLVFTYTGYVSQTISPVGKTQIDVQLKPDAHKKDEVVQLGYTSQLRGEISGSVATVSGEELEKSPVANLTQSFAGRFAGLTTQETYSELSRATTSLNVRGVSSARNNGPLVMIDGIVVSYNNSQTLDYISANEIESVSVLKDASTQALYGIQGANGLIVITTKRGVKGSVKIKTSFDHSVQQVTTTPEFFNSADYAQMRNQAATNDYDKNSENELVLPFTAQQIQNYRAGDNELYPNNNWYDRYFKDFASMQRVGVNVSGGSDKVQFYSNVNFMHQGGQFITDQTEYNSGANNVWVNYRSNVDMKLNRYLKAYVRLSGNIKRERTAGSGNSIIYGSLFQLPPTMYGPLTPDNEVITTQNVNAPTYGMLNRSGYVRHTVTNITSQFGLDLDMGFLTKGLSLSGVLAYQTNAVGSLSTTQDYERYLRTGSADEAVFSKKGEEINTPLDYGKSSSYYYHLTYNGALNYKRDFGKHSVGGMAYMFFQNLTKADTSSPGLLPYNRVSSGAEVTYGYDKRYLVKFDVGYSGSEQYARGNRFVFTPAISAAWVASNEAFMSDMDWLSNLKLRASYGKTANDQSGLNRFAYADNITVVGGGPIGSLQYLIKETEVGNPNIHAETSTKQNYGLDLGLFNALSFSVDIFKERMNNMAVQALSAIPLYQGIPLDYYPSTNSGVLENKGYELTLNYTKALNSNLKISVGGLLGYAKNTVIKINEPLRSANFAYRNRQEGYSFGQEFGYLVDYSNGNGFYNTQEELDNRLPMRIETPVRLGDLKYRDLNNDGKIDEADMAPIGSGFLPRYSYGISGGVTFKSFDFSFLFQGIGQYSSILSGPGIFENDYDGVFGTLHRNAWTQERYNNGEKITSPALSLIKTVNQEANNYYSYDRSYLRLKNVQLSYTLPASLSKAISADKIKFVLSGQNLITWDKMKSDDFGPEGAGYTSFPVYRVYNIGVNVVF